MLDVTEEQGHSKRTMSTHMDMERVVGSDHKAIGVARRGHFFDSSSGIAWAHSWRCL